MALTQVKTLGIADDAVTGAKIADDAINSEHYVDGSIDNAHVADDQINSEHYAAASIDHEHLADDAVDGDIIADNAVGLAHMAGGTDGVIITYDASGNPVHVGPGNDGQVLTSTGAGSPPAFEDAAGGPSLANDSNNRVITGTGSGLNGEANLTFDGSTLQVDGDIQGEGNDGTANNLKWDKSDDTLYFRDSVLASFGTGGDLDIYHNGSNSYINNATGALAITGDDLNFENAARNETYAEMNNGGAVKLYYDNVKKFETTSAGVKAANICKAWCNYDGRDNSIRASFNISSVTDNETGTYTFNWSVATGVDFGFAGAAGEWLISGTDRRVLSYRHGSNTDDYGDDSYLKVRTFGLNTNQTADSKVVTIAAYSN